MALAGRHAARRWSIHLERLRIRNAPFVVGVLAMLGLATAAAQIGLAAIIGAFLAGMVFAELSEQYELEQQALPLYEFLVPLFFVITGSRVDWRLFLDGSLLGIALAVTALAIVGKLVGCGAAALGLGGGAGRDHRRRDGAARRGRLDRRERRRRRWRSSRTRCSRRSSS